MKTMRKTSVAILAAFTLAGCAVTRENQNACRVGWTLLGATIGGAGAGVGVSEGVHDASDGEVAGSAAGGAIAGAIIGYLIGDHVICQVEEAPPPAPSAPPAPPPPAPHKIETLTGPGFEFNQATLTPEGRAHVDHAVRIMQDNPGMHVVVEGNTDSVGTHAYNMKLSQRRADAVRDYMVRKGISAGRIETAAHGETQPVASNDTAAGRAQNRRVDIVAQ